MRDDLEALEAELIEKFKRLDLATKQRLMAPVEDVTQVDIHTEQLQKQADMLHDELLRRHGLIFVSDQAREEHENDTISCRSPTPAMRILDGR
jgi:hypothetical protein